MSIVAIHPAEYVATRLAAGDTEGARLAQMAQYREGQAAALQEVAAQYWRPAAWLEGWVSVMGDFLPGFAYNREQYCTTIEPIPTAAPEIAAMNPADLMAEIMAGIGIPISNL